MEKTFVNRVVDNLDVIQGNFEELLNFVAREIRYREDPRRAAQNALGKLKIERPPKPAPLARLRHVLQHVMHGHDIGTRQDPWYGKEIGHMDQVAAKLLHR